MTTTLVDPSRTDFGTLIAAALGCDGELASVIGRSARSHDHLPHGIIIDSESEEQYVHLLAHGHARLIANSMDGRMVVIEDYPAGELLGLTGLFGWDGVPAQVCAVLPSRTGAFPAPAFVMLMSTHGAVALGVSRMLIRRLAAANRRLAENATLSAPGRIHAELMRRARAGQMADGKTLAIRPMPVWSELALALQTTRETVSRAVSALEKRGILKREADALVIVAPHRLEELIY
jgi:CRP/FNR family cyclic AMP-dependent transcriptional regulator